MSNFNSNHMDNDLNIPWQNDGSINTSYNNSNNQSSINVNNSQSYNSSTNFYVNNATNFNQQTNLSSLGNNRLNNNCYYEYPATFNSSSNSSIALSTNEYDIYNNQPNLVTNDSNLIPSFYQTFNQDINKETNQIIVDNSPVPSNLINPQFNQPIDSTINHHNHYFNNSEQVNCTRFTSSNHVQPQQHHQFHSSNTDHERSPFFTHNLKENIKIEHHDHLVHEDQRDVKRQTNNERERERVRKLNHGFDELKKTCNTVMPSTSDPKMTKLKVLEEAFKLINHLEEEVNKKKLNLTTPHPDQ